MKRRSFCKTTLVAALAASPALKAFSMAKDNPYRANIGIQLYTLRNQIGEDLHATLKAVAAAGYKQVEAYGFSGNNSAPGSAGEMIRVSKDLGMAANSTHFAWESVTAPSDKNYSDFKKILEEANSLGLTHLVVPYLHGRERENLDGYKTVAERMNEGAELAHDAGITLSYHNHSFEFKPMDEGKSGYDVFVQEFSDKAKFEVDVFWVKLAGIEPVDLMKQLDGRVTQLHLKDLQKGTDLPNFEGGIPKEAFKELGNGMIPMEPIIKTAGKTGVEHCHVEQDQSPHPIKSVQQSMAYLKSL